MKKCPYCAEQIQDEAIKCRFCFSDLTVPREEVLGQQPGPASAAATVAMEEEASVDDQTPAAEGDAGDADEPVSGGDDPVSGDDPSAAGWVTGGAAAATAAAPAQEPAALPAASGDTGQATRYSHSGYRYVLGYAEGYFGTWERQNPAQPSERFPRTDDGWRDAWLRFSSLEPNAVEVPGGGGGAPTPAPAAAGDDRVLRYTHTGSRYLLGYGEGFYGIWDRQNPTTPLERFPRNDPGWADAWRRYTSMETNFSEVKN